MLLVLAIAIATLGTTAMVPGPETPTWSWPPPTPIPGPLFIRVGQMQSGIQVGALHVPIDLARFISHLDACDQYRHALRLALSEPRVTGENHQQHYKLLLKQAEMSLNNSLLEGLQVLNSFSATAAEEFRGSELRWRSILSAGTDTNASSDRSDGRGKRQAIVAGITALLSSGVTYLAEKIHEDRLIDVLQGRQELLIKRVDATAVHLNRLDDTVDALRNATTDLTVAAQNGILRDQRMSLTLTMLEHLSLSAHASSALNRLSEGLKQARQNSFNVNLCDVTQLNDTLIKLREAALERGYDLPYENPLELQNSPTSYHLDVKNRVIHLLVHVTLFRKTASLTLYRYEKVPVHQGEGRFYHLFTPRESYLGVDVATDRYLTMTAREFDQCRQPSPGRFICQETVVHQTPVGCLPLLFNNRLTEALRTCPSELVAFTSDMRRLNETAFLVSTDTQVPLHLRCTGSKTLTRQLQPGAWLAQLRRGCSLILPFAEAEVLDEELNLFQTVRAADWDVASISVPEDFLSTHLVEDEVVMAAMTMMNRTNRIPLQHLTSINAFHQQLRAVEASALWSNIGTSAGVIVLFILVVGLTGCYCWRRCRAGAPAPAPVQMFQVPPPAPPEPVAYRARESEVLLSTGARYKAFPRNPRAAAAVRDTRTVEPMDVDAQTFSHSGGK